MNKKKKREKKLKKKRLKQYLFNELKELNT